MVSLYGRRLSHILGDEKKDFEVKAKKAQKLSKKTLVFGLFWTGFSCVLFYLFFANVLAGGENEITINGTRKVISLDNLGEAVIPLMFFAIFILIGVGMIGYTIFSALKEGPYFVGTPTRLIMLTKKNTRSIDWEQFTGDIQVMGTDLEGSVLMELRTGRLVRRRRGPDRYIPEKIQLVGIENPYKIEAICRKRIKENDPTPVAQ